MYATALAADQQKRRVFDGFKFVWYSDFVRCGKLPRSDDGLTQHLNGMPPELVPECVVFFFSYRWISENPDTPSPDDRKNNQYRQMLRAGQAFLSLHPSIDPRKLGIWLVGPYGLSTTYPCRLTLAFVLRITPASIRMTPRLESLRSLLF